MRIWTRPALALLASAALFGGPVHASANDPSNDASATDQEAAPSAPHITDPAGDANGINGQDVGESVPGTSAPGSHGPADLRTVRFQTTYVGLPVGADGIDYQPTGLKLLISTEEAPQPSGPTLLYRVAATVGGGCRSQFQAFLRGPASGPLDPADGRVEWIQRDAGCPDGQGTVSRQTWTASVSSSSKTLTLYFPYSALTAAQLAALGEGSSLSSPKASTRTQVGTTGAPQLDESAAGAQWIIGSDMPADVPCTKSCR